MKRRVALGAQIGGAAALLAGVWMLLGLAAFLVLGGAALVALGTAIEAGVV